MKNKKGKIAKAVAEVEALLLKQWLGQLGNEVSPTKDYSVTIYAWRKGTWGFRVNEVSYLAKPKDGSLSGMSGASYMRGDDIRVPALVESLVLEKVYFGEDIDLWEAILLDATGK